MVAGAKYFVSGDADGKVNVFTKNGTFMLGLDASTTSGIPVEGLYSHLGNLIFRTGGGEWGYVDIAKRQVRPIDCPGFGGRVSAVAIDAQQAQRILVADEEGTVWVLHIKEKK